MTEEEAKVIELRRGSCSRDLPHQEPRDPEAVAILTGDNTRAVMRMERGETAWQMHVTETLSTIITELQAIRRGRAMWPALSVLACCVLGAGAGAYAAVLSWLHLHR